jgi:hypothetical protein
MADAIVRRRACGGHQQRELDEGVDRHEDRANREGRTRHAIGHPDRNRGRARLVAEPDLAPLSHAVLHEDRLAMQRMPRIVNGDVLSVVGGM